MGRCESPLFIGSSVNKLRPSRDAAREASVARSKKIRFPVRAEVTVRFSDVDIMGHVNNARYLSYFEQARVACYKKIRALDLRKMNAGTASAFIVAEVGVKFHAPAHIDERLVVSIRVGEIRTKAFRMEYEVREKKTRRLIATGHSVQVMYNYRKKRAFRISPSLRRKLMSLG